MEDSETPTQNPVIQFSSTVDTSRPFRSVKEAVAVFGERLLVGEVYSSSKPCAHDVPVQEITAWKSLPSPMRVKQDKEYEVLDTLKKLEAELEETKEELRLLKEREEDTEVALASLNAELHKNMSKLAEAEAAAAAKAVAARRITMGCESSGSSFRESGGTGRREEETKRSELMMMRMEELESPTLAQILSIGDKRGYFGGKKERKKIKKKPIIPLVGDLFSRKKASPMIHDPHLYPSSHLFN